MTDLPEQPDLLLESPAARPCTHRRPHPHGTEHRYSQDRCRCAECSAAHAAHLAGRDPRPAYGAVSRYADAAPAREHVVEVMRRTGLRWKTVADRAGVSHATVNDLLYGRSDGQPVRRILPRTARLLLAVPVGRRPPQTTDLLLPPEATP